MKEEAREKTSKFQACYQATYTRVSQGFLSSSEHEREALQRYACAVCYARFDGSHVTRARTAHRKRQTDRQTNARSPLCKRKKRAGLHGQFNGDPDLLSVFNDRQSAANRQNGSINPSWSLGR